MARVQTTHALSRLGDSRAPRSIQTSEVGVVEFCGKYEKLASPGAICLLPCCEYIAGRVSTRVQQLDVQCETKTLDNVFVTVNTSVQYLVVKEKIYSAFYKLTNPISQIQAHVFDVIRSTIPTMNLDQAFESKEEVSNALKNALEEVMDTYGFKIHNALVTDLSPDQKVKNAMNEITAQRNYKNAAMNKAEGEKLLLIKAAEADCDAKYLSGVGVAKQRKAIVLGLRDSITHFSTNVSGSSPKDVIDLLLLTQYFDMLKEVGNHPSTSTVFLPSDSGSGTGALRDGVLAANAVRR